MSPNDFQKRPLKIAILGSGAVGGLYGAMLARSGVEVHFLLHSDYDHVKRHGWRVDSVRGDFHLPNPHVYSSVTEMPRCDVVIVALKTTMNDQLPDWLPQVLADEGIVLTLQNGLDVEADLCSIASPQRVLGGCCFLCSNKVGPGHINHIDYGRIVFGCYIQDLPDSAPARVMGKELLSMLTDAGIDAHWTDDLAAARWRKLMWNIPFNGLSVVLDASTDQIIGCPYGRELAETLIAEVFDGAAACGVKLDPKAKLETMRHTETMVPYDSSMRLDDRHGRVMEAEAIFGNPLRAVQRAISGNVTGTAVQIMPRVEMLYHQLAYRNRRRMMS